MTHNPVFQNLYAMPGDEFIFPRPKSDFKPPRAKIIAAMKLRRSRVEAQLGKDFYLPRKAAAREYRAWQSMLWRCDERSGHAKHYAARGIKVCARWEKFENFIVDLGLLPRTLHQRMTIERWDNDGNYEPGNCYWAAYWQQARNKRTSRRVEWEGETWNFADLAEAYGLTRGALHARIAKGMPLAEALERPLILQTRKGKK